MKNWKLLSLKIHRYLSYLMFIQLFLWIAGGVVFSVIPFNEVTRSGNVLSKPAVTLPADWQRSLLTQAGSDITDIATVVSAAGPAFRLQSPTGSRMILAASGEPLTQVTEQQVAQFARTLYRGEADIQGTRLLDQTEFRLGIVDEMYGKTDVWQVQFADSYGTRFYFDGITGEYLSARNNYWAVYDLFWRLHIMDYSDGESFNGILLRLSAIIALLFTLSGITLTFVALGRSLKRITHRATGNRRVRVPR